MDVFHQIDDYYIPRDILYYELRNYRIEEPSINKEQVIRYHAIQSYQSSAAV
jgi:hypothetical protein